MRPYGVLLCLPLASIALLLLVLTFLFVVVVISAVSRVFISPLDDCNTCIISTYRIKNDVCMIFSNRCFLRRILQALALARLQRFSMSCTGTY